MLRKIEALRTQPKHVRNRYAFWTALFLTACIALIWTISIPARFESDDVNEAQTATPPGVISRSFGDMRTAIATYIDNMRYRVEYKSDNQDDGQSSVYTLDLQALVASSSVSKETEKNMPLATSTTATSTKQETATTTRFE